MSSKYAQPFSTSIKVVPIVLPKGLYYKDISSVWISYKHNLSELINSYDKTLVSRREERHPRSLTQSCLFCDVISGCRLGSGLMHYLMHPENVFLITFPSQIPSF